MDTVDYFVVLVAVPGMLLAFVLGIYVGFWCEAKNWVDAACHPGHLYWSQGVCYFVHPTLDEDEANGTARDSAGNDSVPSTGEGIGRG